jgi:hypothetical protein
MVEVIACHEIGGDSHLDGGRHQHVAAGKLLADPRLRTFLGHRILVLFVLSAEICGSHYDSTRDASPIWSDSRY